MISITINGKPFEAQEGEILLDRLRAYEINLPTICHHSALSRPSGICRLCVVEITLPGGSPEIRRACLTKCSDGMIVQTESVAVQAARERAVRNLLKQAPQSQRLAELAKEHGLRVEPAPDGCIRCNLCIRVCREVVKADALKMERRDEGRMYVVPVEGRCIGCGTCANICPTHVITVTDQDGVRIITIRDEVIGRHPLERCEGCGTLFATPRFLERVHERTRQHADVKTHHLYCPVCSKLFSDRVRAQSTHPLK
jgi:predicted molibdopterin-dependent oxidoreductase YjgC